MDFRDTPDEAEFRTRLRAWLHEHTPRDPLPEDDDQREANAGAWHRQMYEAGWVGVSYPVELGGQGRPETFEAILNEEMSAAGAPNMPAVGHLARTIAHYGTEEQRARHLRPMLSGEVRWCQGFSEPGAGSDLASLSTRAVFDGEHWRITGHKIWTSEARWAQWCLVLVRTDPDVARHRGLSALLFPMDAPGVEVQDVVMASGEREFAEVFFDDVVADSMLGRPGDGWAIAMTLLSYERGPADVGWITRFGRNVHQLEEWAKAAPDRTADPRVRALLGEAYTELRVLQVHVQRSLAARAAGGPPLEAGSVDKLLMTHADQRIRRILLDLSGSAPHLGAGDVLRDYLWSRAQSIFGGTQQIQRNIVAQRLLGLPRPA
jgi:alkylation response protein AidB-like acyl-CoA dehydrogenase